ncbi:SusC/RagA family TonB-linked outer membrane protein [Bacteroides finegoldii]|jgi:TonB-linked SusC/RagA family outer membrane protein|uniref:SusC/RagA family TonB-linked outer membrane protein n=1 Tax=Bacteroides finegoldii TaxID=338188 RepID=A0A173ZD39_9BACE|nr:SusC/RagA family TonB-linked outer membrane protein [Bacteroides finegoldii]KAA5217728.1 SusC/RagA family TonB-linked outer membrane protein [Bacteroides finegoldii]KAA5221789.1 SusC/RagA family TonB-linked outer membrane protein [Bacteroides finegoldii]KAA5227569.1 SusC/RagA family TonB-linked outer membrane protein [Bacteroides finegoldii]KAA5232723.1 SusC/RagA family TonB-linked outer membrane protein [Bacteroides finegoldii]KAA5235159.1 SusC/RagA family TonB-linked outer membrane protei
MKNNKMLVLALLASLGMPIGAQNMDNKGRVSGDSVTVDVGANRTFSRHESTAAVSTVYNEEFDKRASKNISNSLFGQGLGLTALQNAGNFSSTEPTFYVRGLQSLSSSSPLVLVDGLERDMSLVSPEEVESVSILKDAAAVALYGYKGINGAILITTKRGKYHSREIKFTYDHVINFQSRRPDFVNAATYAEAVNEARGYEGLDVRYTPLEIHAFRYGRVKGLSDRINVQLPYFYPNVDWIDETFRDMGVSNKYNIEFTGGGSKFRYYAMLGLMTDKGFVANANMNDGYSTQDKYSSANLRTNLDIDLTSTTKLKLNLLGSLSESSRPGTSSTDLWDMVYSIPSAAFPILSDDGSWGGSSTWSGTMNPVAQSQGAAYSKGHTRSLLADLTLSQDLSGLVKGLGVSFRLAYDNYSSIWEDHSKTYAYRGYIPSWQDSSAGGPLYTVVTGGKPSEMATGADTNDWARQFNFSGGFDYNRSFGKHDVYSQLKWEYEFRDTYGVNTSIYRQNISWYTHYGFNKRYYVDLALVGSASNLLAPGHKWAFSPTVSAAWVLSEEDFMKEVSWVDLLKLRASFGVINADYLPKDGDNSVYNYWEQIYTTTGTRYLFDVGYGSNFGTTYMNRLATINSTHEKAYKYNVGVDATLFKGLNLTVEGYYQRRKDIWVDPSGQYSTVLGMDSPYENAGIVDSWGTEFGLDYTKRWGDWTVNAGGNFAFNRNEIKEQREEPRLYDNLKRTGHRLNQVYGLVAEGIFRDEAEIASSPAQNFSTVVPGDIKYKNVNGDEVIDANDVTAIGYSTAAPEIYYSFHLGAEWKGIGLDAMFQGTGNYSAVLNTKSMFWPLINNTSLSTHYYENRWTPENLNAKYPRLSSQSNANNYQTNTIWLADRSFLKLRNVEVYYKFPQRLMKRTKILGSAKLYVRGVDLLCFDHIDVADPESYGATNPLTKSVVVGVKIGF